MACLYSIKKYFFQESLSLVLESTLSQSCKDYLLEFLCVCATGTEITKVLFLLDVNSRKSLTKQVFLNLHCCIQMILLIIL